MREKTDMSAWNEESSLRVWDALCQQMLPYITVNNESGAQARAILWADSRLKKGERERDEAQGALCRARDFLSGELHPERIPYSEDVPCGPATKCRCRRCLTIQDILSSSAPCPHAIELEGYKKSWNELHEKYLKATGQFNNSPCSGRASGGTP